MMPHSMIAVSADSREPSEAKSADRVCWATAANSSISAAALASAVFCNSMQTLKKAGRRSKVAMMPRTFSRTRRSAGRVSAAAGAKTGWAQSIRTAAYTCSLELK